MLYPEMTTTRRIQLLDGMWKFAFDPQQEGERENWMKGLPEAVDMPVPSSFSDYFTEKQARDYTGDFWYEKDVFIPGEWEGEDLYLRFGAATHRAVVYVNGVRLTEHEGGFLPFMAELNEHVLFNAFNKVCVKVNNELNEAMLPAGRTVTMTDGRKLAKPYFDFFNYSGLNRSVYLCARPEEHIDKFKVHYEVSGEEAEVFYHVETSGKHPVTLQIYDNEGQCVASGEGRDGQVTVSDVRLWDVRKPYLYKFVVQIKNEDTIIDEYFEEIGIRTVEIDGIHIKLNGRPVYLKGFGKHEDADIVGRGYHLPMIKRDFELMKWIGANSFRTSHYPYCEEMYQMADREGFLVIDELPAVGFMESTENFLDAATGKVTSFFEKETIPELKKQHLAALRDLIDRDHNHACVIAWSLFNEPDTLSESAAVYFEEIFNKAREWDMQKRPRTFAMVINSSPDKCRCHCFSDFLSLNRYYGWYVKGGSEQADAEVAFREELQAWEDMGINKPVVFTEYGADTLASEHKLPSVMWSQEYQKEYLQMCHRIFDEFDFVQGEQVWNFADFQTTEGIMRVDGNKKGVFTRQRQPKDSAFYLRERWTGSGEVHKKGR